MHKATDFLNLCVAFLLSCYPLLSSCNGPHRKIIGVVPKATSHLFWQSVEAGAFTAGRKFDVKVLWNGPQQETEYDRQIQIVDAMITRHVDGLAIAAADRIAINASLDRAAAAGIPVTIFDSGVDSTNYMTFVATNNYAAGQMAARKLGQLTKGKGKVAEVMNAPGSASTMERERGFRDVIQKEFPYIRIVAEQFGMSDRSKSLAAAENILTAHPELDGMFASSETSSMGAALALKGRRLSGKVRLVGFDFSERLVEDLNTGALDALVAQDPFGIGYQAVKTLVDKLNGKTPPRLVDMSAVLITKEDLAKPEVKALLFPDLKRYLN
jgi:ribose transport system substrate-binding protein